MLKLLAGIFSTKRPENVYDEQRKKDLAEGRLQPRKKRFTEDYQVDDKVIVGKVIAELKVQDNEPVYQEILGTVDYYRHDPYIHHPHHMDPYHYQHGMQLFNYNIGFKSKTVQLQGFNHYDCYRQFEDNKENYIQKDLLDYELDEEIREDIRVCHVTEAKNKYHDWIKNAFAQRLFIINDEYFDPDKVISCKIHYYDKDYSIPVKLSAFKVKEHVNETWLR